MNSKGDKKPKNFDGWNNLKKDLDSVNKKFFFKEGEIWWMSVGLNIGRESFGKGDLFRRPVLVLKKLSADLFIGIPMSSQEKIGTWFAEVSILSQKRYALLYQVRTFSVNRFESRLATLDDNDFKGIKEKLEQLFKLSSEIVTS